MGTVNCHCRFPLMTGVKTNIVTAVVIEDKNAGDAPQMPKLVATTAQNFQVKEVPADKGYLSNQNLELVDELGGVAYIPLKTNSTDGEADSVWEKMYYFFMFRREQFLTHYHQRSNVESTFSAIKRKFGDSVRPKGDTAMKNEVLAKILCHNITCVIHAWYELGIEPVFTAAGPQAAEPSILRFARPG